MTGRHALREGVRDVLAAPEFETLRALRRAFARGGLPAAAVRSLEDDARIAAFSTLRELLRLLDEFNRRARAGEAVRLVVREQPAELGRMRVELELVIEARGAP